MELTDMKLMKKANVLASGVYSSMALCGLLCCVASGVCVSGKMPPLEANVFLFA